MTTSLRTFAPLLAATVLAAGAVATAHWAAGSADAPSPAQRTAALARTQRAAPAAARPALGFALGTATRDDVRAWAKGAGVPCVETGRGNLRCEDVPAAALGAEHDAASVELVFDPAGRLASVSTWRAHLGPRAALDLVERASAAVAETAGPAASAHGEPDPAWLARAALNQRVWEFRFSDYRASLEVTHLGHGRIVVRELYQAIGPEPAVVDAE